MASVRVYDGLRCVTRTCHKQPESQRSHCADSLPHIYLLRLIITDTDCCILGKYSRHSLRSIGPPPFYLQPSYQPPKSWYPLWRPGFAAGAKSNPTVAVDAPSPLLICRLHTNRRTVDTVFRSRGRSLLHWRRRVSRLRRQRVVRRSVAAHIRGTRRASRQHRGAHLRIEAHLLARGDGIAERGERPRIQAQLAFCIDIGAADRTPKPAPAPPADTEPRQTSAPAAASPGA